MPLFEYMLYEKNMNYHQLSLLKKKEKECYKKLKKHKIYKNSINIDQFINAKT